MGVCGYGAMMVCELQNACVHVLRVLIIILMILYLLLS